jgi:D-alanyl-D-alanine carboxypeptidase/D-alanyl-D-alanine-endopeptidase (penicillin-binding protein 4)
VANYRAAREAERRFWEGLGVQAGEWQGADGSGLSRQNYITPRALTTLLQKNADLAWWVDSLPVSGRTGTLRYRLSADGMAGRVMAKTGTLDGVSGLSGYVRTNGGGLVAFSIIANNYTTSSSTIRRAIDEIVVELARR